MNAIAETAAVEAAPTTTSGNVVMDCQVQKIFYGDFLAARQPFADRGEQDHRFHRSFRLR